MNLKTLLATLTLVFIVGISIWAMTATTAGAEHNNSAATEQMGSEKPAHCDPSNCTPDQAAKCPYGNKAQMSTTANAKSDNICPETKECPPSKCNTSAKSEKATL
ncbi:MAG: hypothetical protein IPI31_13380 [Bacteroidetes bacterium]|jgi:hypothetical protein|nr:hypothetical protein [Bacteroidota bacterium]MBP9797156.1 hypothetical protein [Chitinophagales bacterium]